MLKVTDKELSTVKMCLGQTGTTIHGTCFICVNWGMCQDMWHRQGGWAVRQMGSARLCSGKNIIQL